MVTGLSGGEGVGTVEFGRIPNRNMGELIKLSGPQPGYVERFPVAIFGFPVFHIYIYIYIHLFFSYVSGFLPSEFSTKMILPRGASRFLSSSAVSLEGESFF